MTSDEYREMLHHLDMTQVGAARFFGVADSTSRRWLSDGISAKRRLNIPPAVAMLLCVMKEKSLSPREVLAIEARHTAVAHQEVA